MTTTNERLAKCFSNVFPEIRPDEIPRASTASLAAWDSLAHVILLTAVSEEFGCEIDPEDFEHLVSHGLIIEYLEGRINRSDAPQRLAEAKLHVS